MQMTYLILKKGQASKLLTNLDILSSLVAALCHDLDHPGNNNGFEVALRSELALTHSDQAVLERHHLSMCLRLLHVEDCNIFESLSGEQRLEARALITAAVMATDMAGHGHHVLLLQQAAAKEVCFDRTKAADRSALIGMPNNR
jgi:hypothetical protein